MLDANRIPDVELTPEQIKALTANLPHIRRDEIRVVWVRAGRQNDGKTFVCYVTKAPVALLGSPDSVSVHTGTFDIDGSFRPTAIPLLGESYPVESCQMKGFDPPIRRVRI